MDIEKTALKLIELTYDATMAPEKWQQVMAGFVGTVGTRSALIREVNYTTGTVGLYKTHGFDPAYTKNYRDHFVHLDYFAPALQREKIGAVTTGDQVVPWELQRKSEFCNEYLLPQGSRYCLGITLAREGDNHLLFALQRAARQGDFTGPTLDLIRLVAPHMARAISIHRALQGITMQQQWALSALDALKIGVILLNERGKPVFINRKADYFMSAGYGLGSNHTNLTLANSLDSAKLQRFIADAALAANGHQHCAGGSMSSTGQPGKTLYFHVIPLPRDKSEQPWGLALSGGTVAVFVASSSKAQLRVEHLSALYGLTIAEAKLASLLVDGATLEHAASTLQVSIQTVRCQLKAIFAKTGVNRQAELVARLLTDMLGHQLTD